jgi:hypothetical protein
MPEEHRPTLWPTLGLHLVAGVRGIMPTLAKLAGVYVTSPSEPLPGIGLYFGLLLFFVIGLFVATALAQRTLKDFFIAGICAPALITNIVAGASEGKRLSGLPTEGVFALASLAAAESSLPSAPPTDLTQRGIKGEVVVRFKSLDKSSDIGSLLVAIQFVSASGAFLSSSFSTAASQTLVKAPANAALMRIAVGGQSTDFRLPENPFRQTEVVAEVSREPFRDLLWSLGWARGQLVGSLSVRESRIDFIVVDFYTVDNAKDEGDAVTFSILKGDEVVQTGRPLGGNEPWQVNKFPEVEREAWSCPCGERLREANPSGPKDWDETLECYLRRPGLGS